MVTWLRATWAKRAHNTREPFGPITGPKDFACRRHALNKDFFGAVENHLFAMRFAKCVRDVVLTAYCSLALRQLPNELLKSWLEKGLRTHRSMLLSTETSKIIVSYIRLELGCVRTAKQHTF
jgi:hypothetical protein